MSGSERDPGAEADDLAGLPSDDDAVERAESAWLLAREHDPGAPAPSPAIAREYAELEDLLGDLPPGSSDESWQEEVSRLAMASAAPAPPPRRRRVYRWALAGTLAAAAAVAAVVLLFPRPDPRAPAGELEVVIHTGDAVRGDVGRLHWRGDGLGGDSTEAAVGDRLIVRARPRARGELRVYRAGGTLVARCPGGPGCTVSGDGGHSIEVRLEAPVPHHVILVVGMTGDLPGATMEAYLDAARAANARIVIHPTIYVH